MRGVLEKWSKAKRAQGAGRMARCDFRRIPARPVAARRPVAEPRRPLPVLESRDSDFYLGLLRAYFDSASDAIFVLCDEMKFLFCNRPTEAWLGRSEALLTRHRQRVPITEFIRDPQARAVFTRHFHEALAGRPQRYECLLDDAWIEFSLNQVALEAGTLVICMARDVSERKRVEQERLRTEEALVRSAAEWSHAMDFMEDPIYLIGMDDRVVRANRAFYRFIGLAPERIIGQDITAIMHPRGEAEPCPVCLARRERRDARITLEADDPANPARRPIEVMLRMVRNGAGEPTGVVMGIHDLTGARQTEARLHRLAYHDSLTELPNRTLFLDRLGHALTRARWSGRLLAVLFMDLDRFKVINDTLGHEIGDRLLQSLARRLVESVREGDTVARLGGDEFAILLEDVAGLEDIAPIARKVLEGLVRAFVLGGRELFVTTSIGISVYPSDADDPVTLLKNADTAMYRAKEEGRNTFQFYSADMSAKAFERLALETSLRHALERDEFVLHYQPQADLADGRIGGVEALIRWRHPELGMIPPADFVPLLEETGLIVPVGAWVLRTACAQGRAWRAEGLEALRLCVNLSPRQFNEPQFVPVLQQTLEQTGLPPEALELEITENLLMQSTARTLKAIQALKRLGIGLAIDDFGTGYSSLAYLKRFPMHTLKIDRVFVRDIATHDDDAAIVAAVIAMAHKLKLRVVAEGVETEAQLQLLRQQGCDAMQGYLFHRPLPAVEMDALLRAGERLPPA